MNDETKETNIVARMLTRPEVDEAEARLRPRAWGRGWGQPSRGQG